MGFELGSVAPPGLLSNATDNSATPAHIIHNSIVGIKNARVT